MAKFHHRKLFVTSESRWTFLTSKAWLFLAMITIVSFLTFFVAIPASADNAGDVENGIVKQGYYVSTALKSKLATSTASTLQDTVNKLKSEKHPGGLAILDNATIATKVSSGDPVAFAEYIGSYLNSSLDIVVVVNVDQKKVGLATKGNALTPSEATAITNAARGTFSSGDYAKGVQQIAYAAADKISSKETSQTLTTLGIVVVVILLIVGGAAFLLISTKNNWKKQLSSLQDLNNRVSDLVVRVSEGIDYLPDGQRDQVRNAFGQATAQMSDAQSNMRALESASAIQLVFSGGKFRQQMNNTGSELQNSYNTLQQLERGIEKV